MNSLLTSIRGLRALGTLLTLSILLLLTFAQAQVNTYNTAYIPVDITVNSVGAISVSCGGGTSVVIDAATAETLATTGQVMSIPITCGGPQALNLSFVEFMTQGAEQTLTAGTPVTYSDATGTAIFSVTPGATTYQSLANSTTTMELLVSVLSGSLGTGSSVTARVYVKAVVANVPTGAI